MEAGYRAGCGGGGGAGQTGFLPADRLEGDSAAMRMIATAKDCQRKCRDGKKRKVPDGTNQLICACLLILQGAGAGGGGRARAGLGGTEAGPGREEAGAGPGRGLGEAQWRYHVTPTHSEEVTVHSIGLFGQIFGSACVRV